MVTVARPGKLSFLDHTQRHINMTFSAVPVKDIPKERVSNFRINSLDMSNKAERTSFYFKLTFIHDTL